jgi:hypothetical protein
MMKGLRLIVVVWLTCSFAMLGIYFAADPVCNAIESVGTAFVKTSQAIERNRKLDRIAYQLGEGVRSTLLCPSTAIISTRQRYADDDPSKAMIVITTDAENAYGAMLRQTTTVIYDVDTEEIIDLKTVR